MAPTPAMSRLWLWFFTFAAQISKSSSTLFQASEETAVHHNYFGGTNLDTYLSWYNDHTAEQYNQTTFIASRSDPSQGVALHWKIDDLYIYLAVAVRATGWVGLGLSENGGMEGSDLLIFEATKPNQVIDAYIRDEKIPSIDDCQNWHLTAAHTPSDSDFIIVEVRRLLDTGDKQDRTINNDGSIGVSSSLVIAAWGDSETYSYHGENKARGAIRWFNNSLSTPDAFAHMMAEASEGFFELRAPNHTVDTIETKYVRFCFAWGDLLAMGVPNKPFSIVGFQPIGSLGKYVHHFTVFGLTKEMSTFDDCEEFTDYNYFFGWSPGEPALALPSNVGIYAGPGSYQSFRLEVHYDNPELDVGAVDDSGIRFYYTTKMCEHEVAVAILADPTDSLRGQSLGDPLDEHMFTCPATCTSTVLQEPVTVLREYLHMHFRGRTARNELIRNGEVVHVGRVEHFHYFQQGSQVVQQQPYQVFPGDSFRSYCNYKNLDNGTFGYSSSQEMCHVYLMYYPRQTFMDLVPWMCGRQLGFPPCDATHEVHRLENINRVFGTPMDECPAGEEEAGIENVSSSNAPVIVFSFAGIMSTILGVATSFVLANCLY